MISPRLDWLRVGLSASCYLSRKRYLETVNIIYCYDENRPQSVKEPCTKWATENSHHNPFNPLYGTKIHRILPVSAQVYDREVNHRLWKFLSICVYVGGVVLLFLLWAMSDDDDDDDDWQVSSVHTRRKFEGRPTFNCLVKMSKH